MDDLIKKYEHKFNAKKSKVRIAHTWDKYNDVKNGNYQRLTYSISKLYGNVLDIGSADGFGAYLMLKNKLIKNITCLEIQDKARILSIEKLSGINNIRVIKGIAEDIKFPDNNFDSVFCGETLEHVFDDKKSIKEIHRVVKDIAVFSVPIKGGISLEHVREYKNEYDFQKLLSGYFNFIELRKFKDNKVIRLVLTCKKYEAKI